MMSDVAYLCTEKVTYDDIGNSVSELVEKEIFIEVASASQSEFFKGAQSGLKPEYKFTTFVGDYDGQELIKYNDTLYSIYRTFIKNDETIELYVTKKIGD